MHRPLSMFFRAGLIALAALPLVLGGCAKTQRDYMAVANRPNQVSLIDLEARKVVRTCPLPGRFGKLDADAVQLRGKCRETVFHFRGTVQQQIGRAHV